MMDSSRVLTYISKTQAVYKLSHFVDSNSVLTNKHCVDSSVLTHISKTQAVYKLSNFVNSDKVPTNTHFVDSSSVLTHISKT